MPKPNVFLDAGTAADHAKNGLEKEPHRQPERPSLKKIKKYYQWSHL